MFNDVTRKLHKLDIRDIKHLCLLLGTNQKELDTIFSGISQEPARYYHFREIEKNGKKRLLATPIGRFRILVNRLNKLLQKLYFPNTMHGGLKGRSTKSYAAPHVNKPMVLKSDIKNFFPSVRPGKVYDMFVKKLGCTTDISRYLTRLTTVNGQLPQGSPTSTVIANLISQGISRRVQGLASTFNGQSGTFVDDVVLSGPKYIDKFKPVLSKIIKQEGFEVNESKTSSFHREEEVVIAGIRVDNGLDAPSHKIKETRKEIEILGHDLEAGKKLDKKTVQSIKGKIGNIKSLNKGAGKLY